MSSQSAADPTIYMKDIIKSLYGMLTEMMFPNNPAEALEYLSMIKQAVDELVIETAKPFTTLTYLDEPKQNAGDTAATENGNAGTSGNFTGN